MSDEMQNDEPQRMLAALSPPGPPPAKVWVNPHEYAATVIRVIDGDTVLLAIDQGFGHTQTERFRLLGIQAPEMSDVPAGEIAKKHLQGLLDAGQIVVRMVKIKSGEKRDKYGRYLAIVFRDGVNVNEQMLKDGHAVPLYL